MAPPSPAKWVRPMSSKAAASRSAAAASAGASSSGGELALEGTTPPHTSEPGPRALATPVRSSPLKAGPPGAGLQSAQPASEQAQTKTIVGRRPEVKLGAAKADASRGSRVSAHAEARMAILRKREEMRARRAREAEEEAARAKAARDKARAAARAEREKAAAKLRALRRPRGARADTDAGEGAGAGAGTCAIEGNGPSEAQTSVQALAETQQRVLGATGMSPGLSPAGSASGAQAAPVAASPSHDAPNDSGAAHQAELQLAARDKLLAALTSAGESDEVDPQRDVLLAARVLLAMDSPERGGAGADMSSALEESVLALEAEEATMLEADAGIAAGTEAPDEPASPEASQSPPIETQARSRGHSNTAEAEAGTGAGDRTGLEEEAPASVTTGLAMSESIAEFLEHEALAASEVQIAEAAAMKAADSAVASIERARAAASGEMHSDVEGSPGVSETPATAAEIDVGGKSVLGEGLEVDKSHAVVGTDTKQCADAVAGSDRSPAAFAAPVNFDVAAGAGADGLDPHAPTDARAATATSTSHDATADDSVARRSLHTVMATAANKGSPASTPARVEGNRHTTGAASSSAKASPPIPSAVVSAIPPAPAPAPAPPAPAPPQVPPAQPSPPPPQAVSSFASVLAYLDQVEADITPDWSGAPPVSTSVLSSPAHSTLSVDTTSTWATGAAYPDPPSGAGAGALVTGAGAGGDAAGYAAVAYGSLRGKVKSLRAALDASRSRVSQLEAAARDQRAKHAHELEQVRFEAEMAAEAVRTAADEANARSVAFMDRLLADKDALSARCDSLVAAAEEIEAAHARATDEMRASWQGELKRHRDSWAAAERVKREAWESDKAREIKELTIKVSQRSPIGSLRTSAPRPIHSRALAR